jgi:23S rRNA pseudouridine1911/1915/1917 synthase
LVNALIFHNKDLSMGFNELRPGIVHRIDKDTSGVIVVAKDNSTHLKLSEQFKAKTVHRVYRAVVYAGPVRNEGRIETKLARHPNDRKKFASLTKDSKSQSGKRAVTHFTVKARHPSGLALIECRLETGRTHQIRVHMSEMGCAIVNDPIYGNPKRQNQLKSEALRRLILESNRLALHAAELGFVHPTNGRTMLFKSESPAELAALFEIFKT